MSVSFRVKGCMPAKETSFCKGFATLITFISLPLAMHPANMSVYHRDVFAAFVAFCLNQFSSFLTCHTNFFLPVANEVVLVKTLFLQTSSHKWDT